MQQDRDDLHQRREIGRAAAAWQAHGESHRWPDERVMLEAAPMMRRLVARFPLAAAERSFLGPLDGEELLGLLDDPDTPHALRAAIGDRLTLLAGGDPRPGVGLRADGLPDLVWHAIPGGEVELEVEAKGWLRRRCDNHPAVELSWFEALAYCQWLSGRIGYEVSLPTEWHWQQAATGGNPANEYPWGKWDEGRANTYESELGRIVAVGLYPQGASAQGVFDLAGNTWDWCLNAFENPADVSPGGDARRVVRGGSWYSDRVSSRGAFRAGGDPGDRSYDLGLRVVCFSPILDR